LKEEDTTKEDKIKKKKKKRKGRESEEQLRLGLEGTADGGWISDVAIS